MRSRAATCKRLEGAKRRLPYGPPQAESRHICGATPNNREKGLEKGDGCKRNYRHGDSPITSQAHQPRALIYIAEVGRFGIAPAPYAQTPTPFQWPACLGKQGRWWTLQTARTTLVGEDEAAGSPTTSRLHQASCQRAKVGRTLHVLLAVLGSVVFLFIQSPKTHTVFCLRGMDRSWGADPRPHVSLASFKAG